MSWGISLLILFAKFVSENFEDYKELDFENLDFED